ncbi:uncharacterized conserved protein [Gracilibacillus boraciitolerans JCM 21714]|uniref:Purine nucleoside phosphorylase n=1 Tax=Gracilibacillus boraciitolerans JCM 21714 TaxID=1298598 RepID=W4VEW8_9BACI|nr:peptidoglycan editing factor PgeF [Gracilibacillus boraciitolerans]GAE91721.1 uncharacterized conserved protein [Gracilibacillus boraciitolerans JCM 21714]
MTEPFITKHQDSILWIDRWLEANVVAGFTTRENGVSLFPYESNNLGFHVEDNPDHVLQNRKRMANRINISLDNWVIADQVHNNHVQFIDEYYRGRGAFSREDAIKNTDGLITTSKKIVCTALFADCVPIYFLDRVKGIIAISHAGWRGTVANIVKQTIKKFEELSSNLDDIEVVIGPSICKSCYQVNDHVLQYVPSKYRSCYEGFNGEYHLDLKKLNQLLLLDEGIPASNIHISNYCTSHHPMFFSHRKEQHPTGRMMGGFIAII